MIEKKWKEVKELNYNHGDQMKAIADYLRLNKDMIGKNQEGSGVDADEICAMPCDIELNHFLVPKKWIREIVISAVLKQRDLFFFINDFAKSQRINIVLLDQLQQLLLKMESMNKKVS